MSVYTHKSAKLSKQCSSSFKVTTFFFFFLKKKLLFYFILFFFGPQGIWQLAYKNLFLPLFFCFVGLTLHPGEMLLLYPCCCSSWGMLLGLITHVHTDSLGVSLLVDYWLTAETTRKKKKHFYVVVILLFHGSHKPLSLSTYNIFHVLFYFLLERQQEKK